MRSARQCAVMASMNAWPPPRRRKLTSRWTTHSRAATAGLMKKYPSPTALVQMSQHPRSKGGSRSRLYRVFTCIRATCHCSLCRRATHQPDCVSKLAQAVPIDDVTWRLVPPPSAPWELRNLTCNSRGAVAVVRECRSRGLNPDARRQRSLSPPRLPIPPLRLVSLGSARRSISARGIAQVLLGFSESSEITFEQNARGS